MPFNRNTKSVLALAAGLAVLPLLGGCDNNTGRADRKVIDGVSAATAARTPEEVTKNTTDLDALVKEADASTARKALAKSALANAELLAGQLAAAEVQQQELKISAKLWEMEQIIAQMRHNKMLTDAAKRRNPSEPLPEPVLGERNVAESIRAKASAVRGGEDGSPWIKHDTAPLATVSSVKQTISALNGKIAQLKTNIDSLSKQRDQAIADAAKTLAESQDAKGDESQKLFIKSADSRKQAALLDVQIQAAEAGLIPLNHDLVAAQEHEKSVAATAEAFDAASKTHADQFAAVTKHIESLSAASKAMLDGDKESLKSASIELAALQATAAERRGPAAEQFKAAVQHYQDAVKDSDTARTQLRRDIQNGTSEAVLKKAVEETHEASALRLREADAQASLASLHSSHAMLLKRKAGVIASATGAATPLALTLPAEVTDAKVEESLKEATDAAGASYTAADGLLLNITESATGSAQTRTAARIARATLNVGWAQLAALTGDTETAKTRMAAARGFQKEATDEPNGMPLPSYLYVITDTLPVAGDRPTPPTTAPTAPVEAPADAPAGEAPKGVFGNPQ